MSILKNAIMVFVLVDNSLTNLTRNIFPTRWKLTGHCRQCGSCCKKIILTMTPAQIRSKFFTDLSIRWISWLFGFQLMEVDYDHPALIFTCRHLTPEGKCSKYFWRANVCRNYPLLDYFTEPKLLPGCGYKVRARTGQPVV